MTRRYSMIRVRKGDYLLPSNDGSKFFRLTSYEADGSSSWVDAQGVEHIDHGMFWDGYVYNRGSTYDAQEQVNRDEDILDWERWDCVIQMQRKRREIEEYLLEHAS